VESRSGWSQDLRKLVKIFPHGYTTSHLNLKYNIAAHANVEADSLQVTNYTKFSFFASFSLPWFAPGFQSKSAFPFSFKCLARTNRWSDNLFK
jgi:hypothetical protein